MLESRCAGLSWAEWLVLACASVCDFNSWGHRFVMDDLARIVRNPLIKSPQDVFRLITSSYNGAQGAAGNLYRPFTSLSFAVNWWAGGGQPDGFHFLNRILHLLICLGIYKIFLRLFSERPGIALTTGLLFAVHPIQTEAITYVDGRADALAMFFFVGTWFFFIRLRSSKNFRIGTYVLSLTSYFFGLLSKESVITWLGIAVLTELVHYGQGDWKELLRNLRRNFLQVYAGYLAVTGLYLELRFLILHNISKVGVTWLDNPLAHVATPVRVLTALKIMFQSMGLLLWPAHLSADYSYNEIPLLFHWFSPPGITVATLTLALVLLLAWSFRHSPELFFGLGYFLLTYSIVSNIIIPIGTIRADRLLYMPALGFCFLGGYGVDRLRSRIHDDFSRRLLWGGLGILMALLAGRTIQRNGVWKDELTLYAQTVRDAPGSAKAHNDLGVQYFNRGPMDRALAQYRIAEGIFSEYPDLLNNLGTLLGREGKYVQALGYMQRAIALAPRNLALRNNLGLLYRAMKDWSSAIAQYDWVIQQDPDNAEAHFNKANALYYSGHIHEAMDEYVRTLRIDPANTLARSNLQILTRQTALPGNPPTQQPPHTQR